MSDSSNPTRRDILGLIGGAAAFSSIDTANATDRSDSAETADDGTDTTCVPVKDTTPEYAVMDLDQEYINPNDLSGFVNAYSDITTDFVSGTREYSFLDDRRTIDFIYEDPDSDRQNAYGITLTVKTAQDSQFSDLNQYMHDGSGVFAKDLFPAQTVIIEDSISQVRHLAPRNTEQDDDTLTEINYVFEGYDNGLMRTQFDGETLDRATKVRQVASEQVARDQIYDMVRENTELYKT